MLPTPILRDVAVHAVLDFVPFARARWVVTDAHDQAGVVDESLQFLPPQCVDGNRDPTRIDILEIGHGLPPRFEYPFTGSIV